MCSSRRRWIFFFFFCRLAALRKIRSKFYFLSSWSVFALLKATSSTSPACICSPWHQHRRRHRRRRLFYFYLSPIIIMFCAQDTAAHGRIIEMWIYGSIFCCTDALVWPLAFTACWHCSQSKLDRSQRGRNREFSPFWLYEKITWFSGNNSNGQIWHSF